MKHIYYESLNKDDITYVYIENKPDIYKTYMRRDVKTLETIYCIDMWFVEKEN